MISRRGVAELVLLTTLLVSGCAGIDLPSGVGVGRPALTPERRAQVESAINNLSGREATGQAWVRAISDELSRLESLSPQFDTARRLVREAQEDLEGRRGEVERLLRDTRAQRADLEAVLAGNLSREEFIMRYDERSDKRSAELEQKVLRLARKLRRERWSWAWDWPIPFAPPSDKLIESVDRFLFDGRMEIEMLFLELFWLRDENVPLR
jgi:exonuclease VII small subunit